MGFKPYPETERQAAILDEMYRPLPWPSQTWTYNEVYAFRKGDHASVGQEFSSNLSYDDIRHHYDKVLEKAGWRLVGEEPVYVWWHDYGGSLRKYCKGPYHAWLQFAGAEPAAHGTYSIHLGWGDNDCG